MDYSLREIECFIAVAEELSFTRAAKRLHLAQPPLSRHVRTLEEKLGAELFTREPRGVSMTAAGSLFYDEVRNIPRRIVRAGDAARRCAQGEVTRLRIGFVSAVMNEALVSTLRRFREEHPGVQIMLHDVSPQEQLRAIADGRLDGGFVGLEPPDRPAGIRFVNWHRESLMLYVPAGHELAGRKTVSLKALADESFIAVSSESAPAFASHVRELCRNAGFRPRIILESPRAQAVALMVAAGSGIAILPAAIAGLMGEAVSVIGLSGSPKITHVFACQKGKGTAASEAMMKLL
ncbi:LysR substrate-binding domain-containing protein [Luteolibacter sp. GHJ8]|uniref:LysR substrate-binding domain-containing protein n=1 Tax=Luteolibacter rhizosphaerae TaxID=2989719 RepID=A0ABT3G7R5_9BACT|nr:LysR substrate-binding domain-containing protein [Luteolibacter rhizosphaerae]MCW1915898.1 LysR substrate-binding domain-containing protein [Luteolibacter rhizosphaerae]